MFAGKYKCLKVKEFVSKMDDETMHITVLLYRLFIISKGAIITITITTTIIINGC
jgi:hypothetical protein